MYVQLLPRYSVGFSLRHPSVGGYRNTELEWVPCYIYTLLPHSGHQAKEVGIKRCPAPVEV